MYTTGSTTAGIGQLANLWYIMVQPLTANSEAFENAKPLDEGSVEYELDQTTNDAVDGENSANLTGTHTKSTIKVEGWLEILGGTLLYFVVQQNIDILVICDGMESEKGVGYEVDDCLKGEDVVHCGWFLKAIFRQCFAGNKRCCRLCINK